MDGLVKALKCRETWYKNWCDTNCKYCPYYQIEYDVSLSDTEIKLERKEKPA